MSTGLGLMLFAAIEAELAHRLARRGSAYRGSHAVFAMAIGVTAVMVSLTEWALS